MLYRKLTRCLRYRMEIDLDCLQAKRKGRKAGLPLRRAPRGPGMNTLFQAEESSFTTAKKVAIAIVALALLGLAVWGVVEIAWRLASGR
jgi:hypothetical protein